MHLLTGELSTRRLPAGRVLGARLASVVRETTSRARMPRESCRFEGPESSDGKGGYPKGKKRKDSVPGRDGLKPRAGGRCAVRAGLDARLDLHGPDHRQRPSYALVAQTGDAPRLEPLTCALGHRRGGTRAVDRRLVQGPSRVRMAPRTSRATWRGSIAGVDPAHRQGFSQGAALAATGNRASRTGPSRRT